MDNMTSGARASEIQYRSPMRIGYLERDLHAVSMQPGILPIASSQPPSECSVLGEDAFQESATHRWETYGRGTAVHQSYDYVHGP